ncbi:hypothetical protein BGX27_000489 [Mortierella sp. AM989]|nr:hypothetical protein BGX27_000489 [Mortierella sp. AM989]
MNSLGTISMRNQIHFSNIINNASSTIARRQRHVLTSSVHTSSQRVFLVLARAYNSRVGSSGSASKPTTATTNSRSNPKGLDPDKIKGPGGLTMTQIGKLVQESHAKDLEHMAKKKQQTPSGSKR